jgi:hypothetical protein
MSKNEKWSVPILLDGKLNGCLRSLTDQERNGLIENLPSSKSILYNQIKYILAKVSLEMLIPILLYTFIIINLRINFNVFHLSLILLLSLIYRISKNIFNFMKLSDDPKYFTKLSDNPSYIDSRSFSANDPIFKKICDRKRITTELISNMAIELDISNISNVHVIINHREDKSQRFLYQIYFHNKEYSLIIAGLKSVRLEEIMWQRTELKPPEDRPENGKFEYAYVDSIAKDLKLKFSLPSFDLLSPISSSSTPNSFVNISKYNLLSDSKGYWLEHWFADDQFDTEKKVTYHELSEDIVRKKLSITYKVYSEFYSAGINASGLIIGILKNNQFSKILSSTPDNQIMLQNKYLLTYK